MDTDDSGDTGITDTTTADTIEMVIERWWADHFPGSPVAQVTQAWNHAFAAKEELKRRLQNVTTKA